MRQQHQAHSRSSGSGSRENRSRKVGWDVPGANAVASSGRSPSETRSVVRNRVGMVDHIVSSVSA